MQFWYGPVRPSCRRPECRSRRRSGGHRTAIVGYLRAKPESSGFSDGHRCCRPRREHQPAEEVGAGYCWAAAGLGKGGEIVHVALAVLEAAVQVEQLEGINHMQTLPAGGGDRPPREIPQES